MPKKRRSSKPSKRDSDRSGNNEKESAEPKKTSRKGGRRQRGIRRSHSSSSHQSGSSVVDNFKLRNMLEDEGLLIIPMSSDGNCLFRALSDQLLGDHGQKHDIIRAEICDFMERYEEEFKLFLVFEDDEGNNSEDAADFESYIESMRRSGAWGGNLELVAASRLYRRNITVYSATLSAITIEHDKDESTGSDLLVSFHSGDHYNSVRYKNGRRPEKTLSRSSSERRTSRQKSRRSSLHRGASVNGIGTTSSRSEFTRSSQSDTVTTSASTISTTEESLCDQSRSEQKKIPLATVVGVENKPTKRSSPCPCGSGRRYKKCCWAKERSESRNRKQKEKTGRGSGGDARMQHREESAIVMKGKFRVLQI